MSVKLNSSGGGSVTLQEPTTASNFTLTLPAQTANVITDSSAILNIGSGQIYKDASGNVGVGSTSASGRLHVRQDQDGTTRSILHNRNSSGTPLVELDFITGAVDLSDNRYAYIQSGGGSSQYIAFGTGQGGSPTERARIDSSGALLIGTTSGSISPKLFISANSTNNNAIIIQDTGTAYNTNQWFQAFLNSSGTVAGSIAHTAITTTAYQTSSDLRLKENIQDSELGLEKVSQIKVRSFDWKEDSSHTDYGFVAQELYGVFPEAVGKGSDGDLTEDGKGTWQVEYGRLTPLLVKAIQELKADLDAAKAEIAALKGSA